MQYKYTEEFTIPNCHNDYNISRELFESFPCPLVACCWTDKRMRQLAELISRYFQMSYIPSDPLEQESVEDEYYQVIEKCALDMGMKYYEDLTDEAYEKLKKWFNKINN